MNARVGEKQGGIAHSVRQPPSPLCSRGCPDFKDHPRAAPRDTPKKRLACFPTPAEAADLSVHGVEWEYRGHPFKPVTASTALVSCRHKRQPAPTRGEGAPAKGLRRICSRVPLSGSFASPERSAKGGFGACATMYACCEQKSFRSTFYRQPLHRGFIQAPRRRVVCKTRLRPHRTHVWEFPGPSAGTLVSSHRATGSPAPRGGLEEGGPRGRQPGPQTPHKTQYGNPEQHHSPSANQP